MRKAGLTMLALATLAAAALPAAAGEGKIPLYQPTMITQPGVYVVTRDISWDVGPILDIKVGGVTVDLNGHTLTLSGAAQPVIKISSLSGVEPQPFRILNGTIVGGLHGLHIPLGIAPRLRLSNMNLEGQAAAAIRMEGVGGLEATGIIVIDSLVGFELSHPPGGQMPMVRISGSQIRAHGGIHCTNVVCSIRDSTLHLVPPGDGTANTPAILFNGARGEAVGIIVVDTMPVGLSPVVDLRNAVGIIVVDTKVGVIGGGTGTGAGGPCVSADAMTKNVVIEGGSFTGCGADGIVLLGSHASVRGSVIGGNGGNGIFLGGSNHLVRDVRIADNGGAGIWFETQRHIFTGNILRGNGGAMGETPYDGPGLPDSTDGGGNIP